VEERPGKSQRAPAATACVVMKSGTASRGQSADGESDARSCYLGLLWRGKTKVQVQADVNQLARRADGR